MKRYVKFLSAIAVMLVATLSIKPAMAYFTTYTEAEGTLKVSLGEETIIEENPEIKDWTKRIVVKSDPKSNEDCYVRATAYAPTGMELTYSGTDWTQSGDYWYYNKPVAPGGETSELLVKIDNIPAGMVNGDAFNVVVVYESVTVKYDDNGNRLQPTDPKNWTSGN